MSLNQAKPIWPILLKFCTYNWLVGEQAYPEVTDLQTTAANSIFSPFPDCDCLYDDIIKTSYKLKLFNN